MSWCFLTLGLGATRSGFILRLSKITKMHKYHVICLGCSPLFKPYRYVPPQRVWFWASLV